MKIKKKLKKMLSTKSMRGDLGTIKKNMQKGLGTGKFRGF